jgi:type IV secretory pathway VirJ component
MKSLACAFAVVALSLSCQPAWGAETVEYPGLGAVTLDRPAGVPAQVVIFLSGDGGWNEGVVDMARHLADQGALVAGVDVTRIARQAEASPARCINVAGILEGLSHYVEQHAGLPQYLSPMLVGYSSGATLAYATLAQAPAGTFRGALSLGFCPDLEWHAPLCDGEGLEHDPAPKRGFVYRPARHLQEPWIVLQGEVDEVCSAVQTQQFAAQVPGGNVVMLPKVGHGYSVERNWLPQFLAGYRQVAANRAATPPVLSEHVNDLPIVELPATAGSADALAIMLSGDGGWAGLDKAVAAELNARGLPVVGWDSLRYFWDARTPDGAARDLDRLIRHYAQAWHKSRVLLIGYSQGADTLPFMVNRLPETLRRLVGAVALIGVSDRAFFEFHVSHWLGAPAGGLSTRPEIADARLRPLVCIYGEQESDSPCRSLNGPDVRRVALPGGHHFEGDYAGVARAILTAAS